MSKTCELCGRGPTVGNKKSHSNQKSKRWIGINLQSKKINGQKTKVCTACIKSVTKKLAKAA
jgi:large subunit ribosomal protein L28